MVDMVNELNPDYIVFTGDMVNEHAQEAEGWEPVFAKLKAKHGKYSILGNHDYAKYFRGTEEQRADSMSRLAEVHRKMGFKLLRDENQVLTKDGEQITLLGVNNWGPGFGEYGDLDKAMRGAIVSRPKSF
jgi:predicted MPP superfamily phosphohydrolase